MRKTDFKYLKVTRIQTIHRPQEKRLHKQYIDRFRLKCSVNMSISLTMAKEHWNHNTLS